MSKHSNTYTLTFAAIVTIVCAIVLGLAATKLKPLQELNADVDKKSKTLVALGLYDEKQKNLSKSDIVAFFSEAGKKLKLGEVESTHFVVKFAINHQGEIIKDIPVNILKNLELEPQMKEFPKNPEKRQYPIFAYYSSEENFKAKKADKYVIPVYGYGLWSNCYGVLALNSTGDIVENINYYKHAETPGLGGEIEKEYFADRFKGKKVFDAEGKIALKTSKTEKNDNTVEAVSGATFTMAGVNKMLTDYLTIYNEYFKKVRGGAQ